MARSAGANGSHGAHAAHAAAHGAHGGNGGNGHAPSMGAAGAPKMEIRGLKVSFGGKEAVKGISLPFPDRRVTALIGPSGCGKSTLLRALNRMHDLTPGARVEGRVLLDGEDLYARDSDVRLLRTRVGMVFQKPNPFPTMTIRQNVAYGPRNLGLRDKAALAAIVRESLESAALWDEVRDRLDAPATSLSGGQQQRLCIARALAIDPEVLLMDEPCSALDPLSTDRVEDLIVRLRRDYCVVVVTHNMQQAARISDYTAFLYLGALVEHGPTRRLFEDPAQPQTEAYVLGRFG